MINVSIGDYRLTVGRRCDVAGRVSESTVVEDLRERPVDNETDVAVLIAGHDQPAHLEVILNNSIHGFEPGILLIPETGTLFVGASPTIAVYDVATPRRLVHDNDIWFYDWARHGDIVLMSSEMELAGFSLDGDRLWTEYIDPPWSMRVENDVVEIRRPTATSRLLLKTGQPAAD
ncbi:MAG TPA: hypothetical protein VM452_12965 [Caulifigura sp.]|jgi:hypothetical protein|nr:hypothetical protein [Caulifigura sp.]